MYDFKKIEQETLEFWREHGIFAKSMEARKDAKKFVFFEGPPTANGKPGIHHFLGRSFKDLYGRYKTMRGFFVLRKAGWDTHGLPVEIEIEKKMGFKNKKDIEDFGIANFNKKAKESVWQYVKEWEDMTRRMGFWVDFKDPYITYKNEYIESVWNIIKTIWDKKLLYRAHKVVPFCARCGTPLSSHEVAQGYKKVKEKSVYIKFKVKKSVSKIGNGLEIGNFPLYILAWTTTPWTLPGNVALAVGAGIKYQVVSIKGKDERYILAEDLAHKVLNTEYIIHNTILGSDLVGLEYEPLFEIPELKSKTSYKVYDADFVSTEDGTGVVHTAVMYGEDDYVLGTKLDLPKFHTVDEAGKFINVGKDFDGLPVKHKDKPTEEKTTKKITDYLTEKNLLFKTEEYEHDYPFCWRCDSPLLYYAKSSWFIKMSAVNEQLLKNNLKINWIPEHIKEGRFGQWIKEGKDWAFSRERYWGTPLPAWQCQKCGDYKIIGSVAELEDCATKASGNNYFYLRHGYTTRDERKKMLVSSERKTDVYHLTDEGKKQIQKTAEFIKNNNEIDLIYSSPFIRTMESAEIAAKTFHIKVSADDRLGEISHGAHEGSSHYDCPEKRTSAGHKLHELGESWNDVRARLFDFMNEMESKHSGKNILIVSHGDPIWLLEKIASGTGEEEMMAEKESGKVTYPDLGQSKKLDWKPIPRNHLGELDLHRPFVDGIAFKCQGCGASMKKVPDLIDVWFDSGAMPYAQWHWPFENEKLFKEQFPADFISEGIDQTRGWFYTLLAISTLLGKGLPYKNVMSLGHVLDEHGKKMSKSKGNVVSPFEVMDKVGADTARWYFYSINQPGEYKLFAMKDLEAKLKGFIFTLQNCVRFYELYSGDSQVTSNKLQVTSLLDKWILSRYNGLLQEVSGALDSYDPTTSARAIEKFVTEDLSNWWLRRSRKRKEALPLLRILLIDVAKIIAPFTPFMAEDIYKRMHHGHKLEIQSVHLNDWPKVNKKLIDKKLELEMEEARNAVTSGLAARKEKQIKVRQPLRSAMVARSAKFASGLEELIKEELNVKELLYDKSQESAVTLDTVLDKALISEGYVREVIRQIQDMRKEAGYKMDEKVFGQWHSDDKELASVISEWSDEIKKEALFEEFPARRDDNKTFSVEKEFEPAQGRKIWIGVRK